MIFHSYVKLPEGILQIGNAVFVDTSSNMDSKWIHYGDINFDKYTANNHTLNG